ncbi:MAG: bleomycin resistance protein [Hyphomicrobiales bacterium]|nr:bleomycin resistance protein [Hyphomicrobiales bacterium]
MIQVKRLGHATFSTPDLARQIDYWTHVMGLSLVESDGKRAFFATKLGQEAIALEQGGDAEMHRLSFQIAPGRDLSEIERSLTAKGIASERRTDISPGVREAVTFLDPKGTLIEVYSEYEFQKRDKSEGGVSPLKFGHVASRVQDVQKMTEFYQEVLGFRVSDWMGDHFVFMRCGPDHHTVNFVRYETPRLHHIAFEVKDWGEIHRTCEVLAKNEVQLVWGPLRHIVGHNVAAYHRNPDDLRVECFCEMDLMKDEELGYWEPRPWHEEMPLRPKKWPKETMRSAWGFGSFGTFPGYP